MRVTAMSFRQQCGTPAHLLLVAASYPTNAMCQSGSCSAELLYPCALPWLLLWLQT